MNDEAFLDLFALDLPDLSGCVPDLAQAIALCVPDACAAIEPIPCPPVAGGAPSWWDDIADWLGGIWAGAGDLAEKIGKSFSSLWDKIWGWIGGAIRWLYDWGVVIVDWLQGQLLAYFTWVGDFINAIAGWISNRVWDAATWVKDRAWDAATWVKDRVWDAAYYVRDRVWDAAGSITRGVQSGLEWVGGVVWSAVYWVRDRIGEYTTGLWENIWDAANWLKNNILPPIMGAAQSVADVFREAFDLIAGAIRDALGTLAGQILGALKFAAETTTNALTDLGDKLSDAIKWPWEHIMEPFEEMIERKVAIPGKLFRHEYTRLQDILDDALDPPIAFSATIFAGMIAVMIFMQAFSSSWRSYVDPLFEPELQDQRGSIGRQLLTVGVVQEALNRGFIEPAEADFHLEKAGYGDPAKKALLELRNILPGPSDLIRMAVREVFNPQARAELDLDAEFPEEFGRYAALLGIQRDWAENHWAAHWDLPSPSQGYEMLHRRIIDESELAALLKALDYAPVWRDKLQAISYSPITRVDLRRLYKTKVITEDEVFNGYRDIGYNEVRARWLTDFTMEHYTPEDETEVDEYTKASASQIRLAYRRHLLLRDEAIDKLMELGYTEDTADFLLALDDVQMALNPTTDADVPVRDLTVSVIRAAYREKHWTRERAQEELEALGYLPWAADLLLQLEDVSEQRELSGLAETVIKEEYRARVIDRSVASMRLDELGVLPERRDLLLQRWDLLSAQKTRALTVAQVQRGLREGVFTETEVLSRLSGMGYNDDDAKFLVDDVDKTPEGVARRLSVSQLSRAYKVGAITDAQLLAGLLDLGYSQDDAQVLIDIATPQPEDKQRQLSGAQLAAGFRAGLVTAEELLERLIALGYAQADAELLLGLAARQMESPARRLSVSQLKDAYKAELIDRQGLLAELLKLGYTDRDAGWLQAIIAPEEVPEEGEGMVA